MIECHASLSRVVPHLHLPVQAGSPKILKRMKRYVPIELYISRLEELRRRVPGVTITTDLIVGFPGETEEDFEATMELVRRVRYETSYSYSYSPRPGTAALKYGDDVPLEVKKARLARLMALQTEIQAEKNRAQIGKVEEVLCEGASKTDPLVAAGRTLGFRTVNFSLPDGVTDPARLEGRLIPVRITEANSYSLKGEPALL